MASDASLTRAMQAGLRFRICTTARHAPRHAAPVVAHRGRACAREHALGVWLAEPCANAKAAAAAVTAVPVADAAVLLLTAA
eukprot:2673383-Alexandrium_andersonii.AAC.1